MDNMTSRGAAGRPTPSARRAAPVAMRPWRHDRARERLPVRQVVYTDKKGNSATGHGGAQRSKGAAPAKK